MKTKLTKVHRSTADKAGREYKTQDGRPYTRLAIQIDSKDYTNTWLSGFGNFTNQNWKVGDEVEITIEEAHKNGQTYFNFRSLSKIELLEIRMDKLEKALSTSTKAEVVSDDDPGFDPDEESIDLSTIPF